MTGNEAACPVVAQIIDEELMERSAPEISGAYHALCCMILIRTVQAVGKTVKAMRERKIEVCQKKAAERWIAGRRGILPFEAVCEAFDMDPDYVRRKVMAHAINEGGQSISSRKVQSRFVFGRPSHARNRSPVCDRQGPASD